MVVMIIMMIIMILIGGGDYDDDEGDYFDNGGHDCLLDVCSNVEGFPAKERGNCLIHDRVILVEIFWCFFLHHSIFSKKDRVTCNKELMVPV